MKISTTRHLWAPNVWGTVEVCRATILLDPADRQPPAGDLLARIDACLPERAQLFAAPAHGPTGCVELLGQVALTLQAIARGPAGRLLRVCGTPGADVAELVVEARDPVLVGDCLHEAAAVLEPVVGDDRGGAVRLFHLAHARLRQGRDAQALEAFREAVRRAPSYTGAWYGIATAAARVGADDEAAEAREEFRRLKARDAESAAANLERDESERLRILLARWYATAGTIAIAAGDAAGAERAWRRGMAVAPHVTDNVRALAELYRRQGRAADAARIAADVPLPPERRGP